MFLYNISSLEDCDRVYSNYLADKVKMIKKETVAQVTTIKKELNIKLDQIEKENSIVIKVATSFSWLAILVISLVFIINALSDIQKLIRYLKKNYYKDILYKEKIE